MNPIPVPKSTRYIYRVDKFTVPMSGRDEFVHRVRETHEFLRQQKGLLEDLVLEKPDGPEASTIITVAVWEDQKAVEAATAAMLTWRRQTGFDPLRLIRQLEIQADRGMYRDLD